MSKSIKIACYALGFALSAKFVPTAFAAMPTASLPIEPATGDKELNEEPEPQSPRATEPAKRSTAMSAERSAPSRSYGEDDFGANLRLSMIRDGFGAQLKLLEYPRQWLALTQTFRYFKSDEEDRLYRQRQGFLLGTDLHPWRKSFVSPFFNVQGGWEKFYRDDSNPTLDSFVAEASTGLELRLGRLASIVGQWTEAYYPGLDEVMFTPKTKSSDPKHHAVAEVLFNLKWESSY